MTDLSRFATPLSETEPSGPNLEYDADFQALGRAQMGKPEQVMGNAVKAAEPPDWNDVKQRAEALLARTRDLRVVLPLTRALLSTEGIAGLASGLSLIHALLESQWLTLHPQLDADDHDDPTFRVNSLVALCSDDLLKALRESTIVQSKALGRFSLRDVRIAAGKLPAPATMQDPPNQAQIDAAFLDADLAQLQRQDDAVATVANELAAIDRLMVDRIGSQSPDLKPLSGDVAEIKKLLAGKLAARQGGQGATLEEETAVTAATSGQTLLRGGSGAGEVASREDVVRQLDRICEYYRRYEPSSPLPILLRRARRLVSMDFMAIVRDLTPGGVAEAESLAGVEKSGE